MARRRASALARLSFFPAAPGDGSRNEAEVAETAAADPAAVRHHGVVAARRLNRSAALLAASVLTDSAVEHYRGSFRNPGMYAPLAAATLSLLASAHGHKDERANSHALRDLIYAASGAVGIAGTGFHLYNVAKRPGGWSWHNLFYAAPIGAPFALCLSGLFGVFAERLRDNPPDRLAVGGISAGRGLAALAAFGLLGTTGEAGLLHFRGAFQNPAMYLPVTMPPAAAVLLAGAAAGGRRRHPVIRWWLRLTALMGFAGSGFHAYGVSRAMGGWRNWSQNLLDGPPLPAPPSFSALALAGLAALGLLEVEGARNTNYKNAECGNIE